MKVERAASIEDLRRMARRRLPRAVFDFIDGGAESEATLRRNQTGFDEVEFLPRVLIDVRRRDSSVELLGRSTPLPLAIAPTGLAALAWREADIVLARAAEAAGIPFTVSTSSSVKLEQIRTAVPRARLWFQIYAYRDRALVESLIRRARDAGSEALVLTVDVPVLGRRYRDIRNRFTVPLRPTWRLLWDLLRCPRWSMHILRSGVPKMRNLMEASHADASVASLASLMTRNLDAGLTWDGINWVREAWAGKLILKGVLSPADAEEAVGHGFDAVCISNHGGRQLDFAPSSISVLPQIAAAVGGRIDLLLDGGVRRGTDIAKAMALGARAVMVGRASLYGVGAGGEQGAAKAIAILAAELDQALALVGCPSAAALNTSFVRWPALGQRRESRTVSP